MEKLKFNGIGEKLDQVILGIMEISGRLYSLHEKLEIKYPNEVEGIDDILYSVTPLCATIQEAKETLWNAEGQINYLTKRSGEQ